MTLLYLFVTNNSTARKEALLTSYEIVTSFEVITYEWLFNLQDSWASAIVINKHTASTRIISFPKTTYKSLFNNLKDKLTCKYNNYVMMSQYKEKVKEFILFVCSFVLRNSQVSQ